MCSTWQFGVVSNYYHTATYLDISFFPAWSPDWTIFWMFQICLILSNNGNFPKTHTPLTIGFSAPNGINFSFTHIISFQPISDTPCLNPVFIVCTTQTDVSRLWTIICYSQAFISKNCEVETLSNQVVSHMTASRSLNNFTADFWNHTTVHSQQKR